MTFVYTVAIAVVAVVAVHLVVGWVFSSRLRADALLVGPRDENAGVRVRSIGDGEIVLEAPEPRQDIGHPGVLGLDWGEGYGQVGDVRSVADGRVTRSWIGPGMPSACEGRLEDCEPVLLDPYAFPNDPTDRGLAFETVSYESPLGPMEGWLVPSSGPRRWVIACHGWNAERRELLRMLPVFHAAGSTTFIPSYRNDPGMPTDPSGHHRFGSSEWEDLEAATQHAVDAGAEEIVLAGCSTGGALVMAFLEKSPLAELVIGVILDAPNVILADTFRHGAREMAGSRLMKELGLWISGLRWDIDWEATNYVDRSPQCLRVPTLVFHGTSDQTVPISESRRLAKVLPDVVELVEVTAAGHVMSWNANPEAYERRLKAFLDRI